MHLERTEDSKDAIYKSKNQKKTNKDPMQVGVPALRMQRIAYGGTGPVLPVL
jgi:hypothetical protein